MILTWRENLQLTTSKTETCTNYYAGLEDGLQYKPRHHTTNREAYKKAMARRNGRNFETKQRILAGDNS